MNSPTVYIEISQSSFKLLNGREAFEFSLDRQQNGRLADAGKEKLTSSLQDFLKRKNWQTKLPAWCAIGARGVSLRRLTLPASTKDELRRLLRLQIETEFPLPPEQLAWGYQVLRQTGSRLQEILVVAVKKEMVEDYSQLLSACGLSPVFTVAPLARGVMCPDSRQHYSILEVGSSHSELITFEDGAPASIRILPWGSEQVTGTIKTETATSPDEAGKPKPVSEGDHAPNAADSSSAGIESLAQSIDPKWIGQTLYLLGASVRQPEFVSLLSAALGGTVKCELIDVPESSLSAAIAGMKKSHDGGTACPLIHLQLNGTSDTERVARPAPLKWAALAAAFALLLLFLPYGEALLLKPRLAKKLESIKSESSRLGVIDREFSFLQELKKSQSPYLDTVYLVANSTPPGTRFETFAMNRRGEISLKGNMQNAQQVTDFRAKLIGSGFFSTVVVDEQTPTPDRQKVAVRITAKWNPDASRKAVLVEPDPSKVEKPKIGEKETKAGAPPPPPTNSIPPGSKEPVKESTPGSGLKSALLSGGLIASLQALPIESFDPEQETKE